MIETRRDSNGATLGGPRYDPRSYDERQIARAGMFSPAQQRAIADAVQQILRNAGAPELPGGEISFRLFVKGADPDTYADILNPGAPVARAPRAQSADTDHRVKG
jgi:hypothetical protein